MGIDLTLSLHQQMKLSQKQVQALEILTLDVEELNDVVEKEYLENPLLDKRDHQVIHSKMKPIEDQGYESEEDRELLIYHQLREDDFSDNEWKLIHYLTLMMDEEGYLRYTKEDILDKVKLPSEMVDHCLTVLKGLEPAGIMAYDTKENLILQLERIDKLTPTLRKMIESHLLDIADGKISTISRNLKMKTADVRYNIRVIQSLRPHPLEGYDAQRTQYVVPDLLIEQEDTGLVASLNDQWVEDYQISDYYYKMMEETKDKELYDYFKFHYEKATLMLKNIAKRRETMLQLANTLIKYEGKFFQGVSVLTPLTMTKVAADMKVHVSTVSRAVKNKYIQYPAGTIAIRELFQLPAIGTGEEAYTGQQIKEMIGLIITKEDGQKPYSDAHIVNILKNKGIKISRRAVAKYRNEMHIKSSVDRRERE